MINTPAATSAKMTCPSKLMIAVVSMVNSGPPRRARHDQQRPQQVVYDPSRPVSVLFIVKTARFRLFRVLADGRTVTTAMPGPGSVFGEMDLLGRRMVGTRAEAIEAGDLCLMSRSDVQTLLLGDPRIATRVAEQMGARIAELEQRLTTWSASRCSNVSRTHTLGVLAGSPPAGAAPESVRLTHGQLAGLVGATHERTTRALAELAERGLVSLHREGSTSTTSTTSAGWPPWPTVANTRAPHGR